MTVLTPTQLRRRRQVETVIRLMAPVLDTVLFVGDRLSRVAGRNEEVGPPVARRTLGTQQRTRIGGPPA